MKRIKSRERVGVSDIGEFIPGPKEGGTSLRDQPVHHVDKLTDGPSTEHRTENARHETTYYRDGRNQLPREVFRFCNCPTYKRLDGGDRCYTCMKTIRDLDFSNLVRAGSHGIGL